MLTSLLRQKHFQCEVTSTSTEKLGSPCHNQWFNTVSINLGTSLRFDHDNEKMCVSPRLRAISLSLARLRSCRRKLPTMQRGEITQEFTLLEIFFSLSQQCNRHFLSYVGVRVSVVLRLRSDAV